MRTVVICALLLAAVLAYDFTKPENGNELKATLKDEADTTFVIFVHAVEYEGEDDEETKKINNIVKDMKEDVKKDCTKEGLKDEDYTFIDVEIELEETAETEPLFGNLLVELGFEEPAAEGDDAAAEGDDAAAEEGAAEEGAEEPAAEEEAPARRRSLQEEEAAPEEGAAEEGAAEEGAEEGAEEDAAADGEAAPADLSKLAKAPYALVMRNQQGFRVSGNNISTELCY